MKPGADTLEPERATLERWLAAAARLAFDHIDGLGATPAMGALGAAGARVADEVSRPIGEAPLAGGMDAIVALLARAAQASLTAPGPGYLAYVPGGGLPAAALADLMAGALNRYVGMAAAAPALARLEQDVLAWLARELGYGPGARGVFTSGGSLATLTAVIAARHAHCGDGGRFDRATAYTSTEAHHSVLKALRLAGIPDGNVRRLRVDAQLRLRADDLAAAIDRDRRAGYAPFLVIATAGTTNTGAIDPLPLIAEVCGRERLWLHADAAYGGAFVLAAEGRRRLEGIARADSVTLDPHKGLFLPYGTGCLLVREGEALRRAYGSGADYLQDLEGERPRADASWSPAALGPELSRSFRGLRLWLPLMLHGAAAFREALAEKLALAERLAAGLERLVAAGAALEIVARPQLSTVAFRLRRARDGGAPEPLDRWSARNAALLEGVNGRRRVHLSSTLLPAAEEDGPDGRVLTLRACVLSFRTHAAHIDAALEDVAAATRDPGAGGG